ncbi:MAG: hypothetical protein EA384_00060 [Spirochaetaceae bacterium]|nr:MAG: hypothetical protein EA384_00060 [Spirochaetaceae bacterium]
MDSSTQVDRTLVEAAARRLAQKQHDRERRLGARRERARRLAAEIAAHLGSTDSSLERVIGFGSTFETWRSYHENSDIDLAIIGGNWSALWRELPPSEFQISLVELPLQNQEFIDHVQSVGVTLYENCRHD